MILIISLLFGSIAAIIFALVYKAKRDTKKQIQQLEAQLAKVALQHRISWSEQLISKHRAFAWCADKQLLFFTDDSDAGGHNHLVDMNQVTRCKLIEQMISTPVEKGVTAEKTIAAVAIELCFDSKECITLPMYREIEDGLFERTRLTEEARRWIALIRTEAQHHS